MVFFNLPVWLTLPLTTGALVALSIGVLLALRRWVHRASHDREEWDRVLGYAVGTYGVFYGVTLGLIAAAAYGNYVEVDDAVLQESSQVAVLYRSAAQFPEPTSAELEAALVDYARAVVDDDWPLQQQLVVPENTSDLQVDEIHDVILAFAPETLTEVTLQAQTMSVFNTFVTDRRQRIALTELALPGVLWVVLLAGAAVNAVLIGLIQVRNLRVHVLMASLIALFVSLLLYAIAGFDHAYAGPISVGPDYFVELLEGLLSRRP